VQPFRVVPAGATTGDSPTATDGSVTPHRPPLLTTRIGLYRWTACCIALGSCYRYTLHTTCTMPYRWLNTFYWTRTAALLASPPGGTRDSAQPTTTTFSVPTSSHLTQYPACYHTPGCRTAFSGLDWVGTVDCPLPACLHIVQLHRDLCGVLPDPHTSRTLPRLHYRHQARLSAGCFWVYATLTTQRMPWPDMRRDVVH